MKKLFFFLGIILLVAVANAGPPPDNPVFFEIEMVTDVIEVEQVDFISTQFSTLDREVSFSLPYSNLGSSSTGFLKTNKSLEFSFLEKQPQLLPPDKMEITLKCPLEINPADSVQVNLTLLLSKQHSNYGYPLSADRQHGNS